MTQDMGNKIMTQESTQKEPSLLCTKRDMANRKFHPSKLGVSSEQTGSFIRANSKAIKGGPFPFLFLLLLMLFSGVLKTWGQTTYTYYAIHNSSKGYLKQVNGAVATETTFQYADAYGSSGLSIWVFSCISEDANHVKTGYLQQEMFYLNVANDNTLYLSPEKNTEWTIETVSGKNRLKPNGSSKYLCADNGPLLKSSPTYYYNACEMTITDNGKWTQGATTYSFTVQSPQLVTYLRTYYTRNITYKFKNDANSNQSATKDSRCYCSLTYDNSQSDPTDKGDTWDINTTSGVIYHNNKASGNVTVAATYILAALDPIALSKHPATTATVTLTLQPSPFAPDASKNYLLYYTYDASYRFPYDDGTLEVGDAVKTDASKNKLTEPTTSPNDQISWKIVRDDEGFYSFQHVTSNKWLRFNENNFNKQSDYGVVEMGETTIPDGDAAHAYKFRLYKSGNIGKDPNNKEVLAYCILPYNKQFAVYKNDGVLANAIVALNVYTTPKAISLDKANTNTRWALFAYEAEYRLYSGFSIIGPPGATKTGDYTFNVESYYSRNIVGSPNNSRDLEIKNSYDVSSVSFTWQVSGDITNYATYTNSLSGGKGTLTLTVNTLPTSLASGKISVKAYGGTAPNRKSTGSKELTFNLYGEPALTDITSLSQIIDVNGHYRLTEDVSDRPGVETFSGILDGNFKKISGLNKALFNTLDGGRVKNVILENVNIPSSNANNNGDAGAICNEAIGASRIYNCGILPTTTIRDNNDNITGFSGSSIDGSRYVGGIVGLLNGTSRVINCFSYANIKGGTERAGIVGYNNYESKYNDIRTMVMNCMFYGNITSGGSGVEVAPIYGGKIISNADSYRLNNYNYFCYEQLPSSSITKYNCALAAEERYLNRFEFYRHLVNSTREMAAWYATGSTADAHEQMAKWVLDNTIAPYPILKEQGTYPSVVNYEDAPELGTLDVTINQGSGAPAGATVSSTTLTIYDKDIEHYHYNYRTVRLPYYNEVGTLNYTGNKVVTGWKITSMTGGTQGSFSTTDEWGGYNFADRSTYAKDLYSESGQVFSQGAYFDVPDGVTGITIEPYWGNAVYLSDPYYDMYGYAKGNVEDFGPRYYNNTNCPVLAGTQKVYTSISNAVTALPSATSVYDNAVVLVGNYHKGGDSELSNGSKPFTIMSIDLNKDNEPDYSLIFRSGKQNKLCPIRYDFINIPGMAMAHKTESDTNMGIPGNAKLAGWFEITNTALIHYSQFEYDSENKVKPNSYPVILLGGVIEQIVSTNGAEGCLNDKTTKYIHVGSNVWFKLFNNGCHLDKKTTKTPHIPISVTGGDYEKFYLSGYFKPDAQEIEDDAECYISGGRFGEVAGAGQEPIKGNVQWMIDHADIENFYGGGINDKKPITGNITVTIKNSKVETYCGGPKFGNMSSGTTLTTTATDCIFGSFYGAGFGGTSYYRYLWNDKNGHNQYGLVNYEWNGTTWVGNTTNGYTSSTRGKYVDGQGILVGYDYEHFEGSSTNTVARLYMLYASLSLAQTKNVTSTLTGCTINYNFYGGGKLGSVDGSITSTLTDCIVKGNAFGAGYSGAPPSVTVFSTDGTNAGGFKTIPNYNTTTGVFEKGVYPDGVEYTWSTKGSVTNNSNSGSLTDDSEGHWIHTDVNLTGLGTVSGNVSLNIIGNNTHIYGDVYGGGAQSKSNTDYYKDSNPVLTTKTTINLLGGTVDGDVYGGGLGVLAKAAVGTVGNAGYEPAVEGVAADAGNVKVNLNGLEKDDYDEDIHKNLVEAVVPDTEHPENIDYYKLKEDDKGCIVNRVFGCNNLNGTPKGTSKVHVFKTNGAKKTAADKLDDINDKNHFYHVEAVYGGGNLAPYEPTAAFSTVAETKASAKTQVVIEGCDQTSIRQVYGGGNAASTPATQVDVHGTYEIEEVFGGGNGKDDISKDGGTTYIKNPGANVGFKDYWDYEKEEDMEAYNTKDKRQASEFITNYVYGSGEAHVNIHGGRTHRVYGGSNTKGNVKAVAVTMLEDVSGCDFKVDEAYGGGKSAQMDGQSRLEMACIPGMKNAYGGAEAADIQSDVTLNITNGNFDRVFGGNNVSGTIHGKITVNIEETGCHLITIGQLYGGGNQAAYTGPLKTGSTTERQGPTVNVKSFTSIGEIYGGGYGKTATVTGDTYVNINVCDGKNFGDTQATEVERANEHTGDQLISFSEYKRTDDGGFEEDENGNRIVEDQQINVYLPPFTTGSIGGINNVYGGGNAAKVEGNTHVNIGTETQVEIVTLDKVPDQDENGDPKVDNNNNPVMVYQTKDVKGANIIGNVYGGGNAAEVTGSTNVQIGQSQSN